MLSEENMSSQIAMSSRIFMRLSSIAVDVFVDPDLRPTNAKK